MYFSFLNFILFSRIKVMTCGCKHKKGKKKRGSGRAHFLSGVTWHKGSGTSFTGSGFKKRKNRREVVVRLFLEGVFLLMEAGCDSL